METKPDEKPVYFCKKKNSKPDTSTSGRPRALRVILAPSPHPFFG